MRITDVLASAELYYDERLSKKRPLGDTISGARRFTVAPSNYIDKPYTYQPAKVRGRWDGDPEGQFTRLVKTNYLHGTYDVVKAHVDALRSDKAAADLARVTLENDRFEEVDKAVRALGLYGIVAYSSREYVGRDANGNPQASEFLLCLKRPAAARLGRFVNGCMPPGELDY